MKPTPPARDAPYGVAQVTLDLFSSEGAPSPVDLRYRMPLRRAFEWPQ